ncbi:MAG: trimethylamine methyltransferase family protein [Bacillota bacterium]
MKEAFPVMRFLSDEDLGVIYAASLRILEGTGMVIKSRRALELLGNAGCAQRDGRIMIPPRLVEWAMEKAPSTVTLHDREGRPSVLLEGRTSYFGTGSDCPNILDHQTGERRPFTKDDVSRGMRVCEALPNIDFVMSMGLISDVPRWSSDRHQFQVMLTWTRKPVVFTAHDLEGCRDIVEMAAMAANGVAHLYRYPQLVLYSEPTSPLVHSEPALDKLLYMASLGLPTVYSPGMMPGATAPVTAAGALALATAEALVGIVLGQLEREGAPFIFGAGISPMDMRTSVCSYASPEFMRNQVGVAEMARYLGLPSWGYAGCSDAKVPDQQAALESGMWAVMTCMMGANLVHDVGYLESGLTGSLEMLVLNDEAIGAARRIAQGIGVDEESLAVEAVHRVGPGGQFLTDEHTLAHFREDWVPGLLDRQNHMAWQASGQKTLRDRAKERVEEILRRDLAPVIPEDVAMEIEGMVKRADGSRMN